MKFDSFILSNSQPLDPAQRQVLLAQITLVERVVRPVRAGVPRKRKMREELLAHLTAIYEEEMERLNDSSAALAETARRFGDPGELLKQLQSALPRGERIEYWLNRHVQWRAPESAGRYCRRLGIHFFLFLLCMIGPIIAWILLGGVRDQASYWIALRTETTMLLLAPLAMALVSWLYFQMRDVMWGVFGSRKSMLRVGGFALGIAGLMFVSTFAFLTILLWGATDAVYALERAAEAGAGCAVFYILIARVNGPKEISDTIWASLTLD